MKKGRKKIKFFLWCIRKIIIFAPASKTNNDLLDVEAKKGRKIINVFLVKLKKVFTFVAPQR